MEVKEGKTEEGIEVVIGRGIERSVEEGLKEE
jgi:hypothetical protein